jgi:hypothetical protein
MAETGKVGLRGQRPAVKIGPAPEGDFYRNGEPVKKPISGDTVAKILGISEEQQKYLKAWKVPGYRNTSPGEDSVDMFLDVHEDLNGHINEKQKLIDFGCGTGRASLALDEHFDVIPMDFAFNCLDDNVAEHFGDRFVEHDITEKTHLRAEWGFCCDVMEHLPPEQIDDALEVMLESCDNVFFQIATIPDYWGHHKDIKEALHLTVWDYERWLNKFAEHGVVVHRSRNEKHHVIFCVSGYEGFSFDKMKMNTSAEEVYSNIRENLSKSLKMLTPFEEQSEQKVVVLCGGPSLNDYVDEIKEHKKNGAKIVTMNGTYAWAKEHGLWPVTQFMIDAREFNARFVEPIDDQNIYIMAGQVHPALIDKLPAEKTYIFNCNLDPGSIEICNEMLGDMYSYDGWFPVPGGSTVTLRCLPALMMIGFRDIELYGFDSCLKGGNHHAFPQPENDIPDGSDDRVAFVTINDKTFPVEAWHLCQANEFIHIYHRVLKNKLNLQVHGDGLIAHCMETGVKIVDQKEQ